MTLDHFKISNRVSKLGVHGAYGVIYGLNNRLRDPAFDLYLASRCEQLLNQYSTEILQADPVLVGFRDLHTKIGRSNRKYPAAPEALCRQLLRSKTMPRINLAVDIYNLVSLETRLSMGAHDLDKLDGEPQLALTDGSEYFLPLGKQTPETVNAGEYCYLDDREIICRLEYKQVEKTKVNETSHDIFYIVQGNLNTNEEMVTSALQNIFDMTIQYCGRNAQRLPVTIVEP